MTTGAHVFTGISRKGFERMKKDLRALGVRVPDGDACTIGYRGISGAMTYSERDGRIEVRIIQKPIFVSSRAVRSLLARVMRRYTTEPEPPATASERVR